MNNSIITKVCKTIDEPLAIALIPVAMAFGIAAIGALTVTAIGVDLYNNFPKKTHG